MKSRFRTPELIALLAGILFAGVLVFRAQPTKEEALFQAPQAVAPLTPKSDVDETLKIEVGKYLQEKEANEYKPQQKDGWVADWGLWADNSQQDARNLYKSIPKSLGLKYLFGNHTKNELVIFSDPYNQEDRNFYRLLLNKAREMDATVYVFPLSGSAKTGSASRILCTADPEKAWEDWTSMMAPSPAHAQSLFPPRIDRKAEEIGWEEWLERNPQISDCFPERSTEISQLATDLGVSHTPTVIFANGRAWPSPLIDWNDITANWQYVKKLGF